MSEYKPRVIHLSRVAAEGMCDNGEWCAATTEIRSVPGLWTPYLPGDPRVGETWEWEGRLDANDVEIIGPCYTDGEGKRRVITDRGNYLLSSLRPKPTTKRYHLWSDDHPTLIATLSLPEDAPEKAREGLALVGLTLTEVEK